MTIRVLVADDEKAARTRLVRLLGAMGDAEITAEAADGATAIAQVQAIKPDVVFLDIEMPEGSGLDVAQAVASSSGPAIVFVTAFDQYAVRAFDVHAVDYLLKPVAQERLAVAWDRVRDHLKRGDHGAARVLAALKEMRSAPAPAPRYRDRLLATRDGRSTIVSAADVEWIEAAANYVKLHVAGGSHTIREAIGTMEAQLDPRRFARIHRGAIVNLDQVREIQPWFSGDQVLIMRSGAKLKLSRTYRKAFESRFTQ